MTNAIMENQDVNTTPRFTSTNDSDQLLTIRQFCVAFQWPSESAMRAYIYRAEELGISEAFVRVGRRVLVAPSRFFYLIKKVESRSDEGGQYETTTYAKGKMHL